MKSVVFSFLLLCGIFMPRFSNAQLVTIPDLNFAAKLELLFPDCITGDQLDTQCPEVLNTTSLVIPFCNIADLTGIEYFVSLTELNCALNDLTFIPTLPATLTHFSCHGNDLTALPILPAGLIQLSCGNNNLTSLPVLPEGLIELDCSEQSITALPVLPNGLQILYCNDNQLTSLPELPQTLWQLACASNQLTTIPDLPMTLQFLSVQYNPGLTCLPPLPSGMLCLGGCPAIVDFAGTQITCMPNQPEALYETYPVCELGNINNPNDCLPTSFISGTMYHDISGNCLFESTEPNVANIKLYLINSAADTIGIVYSDEQGAFDFFDPGDGNYTISVDTFNKPYAVNCMYPGSDTAITIVNGYFSDSVYFALNCSSGPDLAVITGSHLGIVFPGQPHTMTILAGDLTSTLLPDCATSVGGTVTINITGNATYVSPAPYALIPTVSGNTFVYEVADFSTINIDSAFHLIFQTNTTAVAGDSICADVSVNPTVPDLNPANQHYYFCYPVVNSYDPNIKEVYPTSVEPGYDDWLMYTIHFQNTGNAPAFNIRLEDTLSTLVNSSSFELLNHSHPVDIVLSENFATFKFNNIMLPDSASDPEGSIGFIQYRVKPLSNLPGGTEIDNKCYIYFDYNAPIITNTATTHFIDNTGLTEGQQNQLTLYPNPTTGVFSFQLPTSFKDVETRAVIYNIAGEKVSEYLLTNTGLVTLDLTAEKPGIYFMTIQNGDQVITCKLIKQ